jgi:hypothetical protein
MAVRWWTCEGVQIPASVSSEYGTPSECDAPLLHPRCRRWCSGFCVPQAHWRAAGCESGGHLPILLPCPRPRSKAPSQVPPLQASAVLCPASIALRSRHWTRKSGYQAPPTTIAGAKRFPISVCRTYLVCGLPSPGWAWRGRVRCRNGTLLAAPLRVTQGMMS